NGGSTMHALHVVEQQLGENFSKNRILLIHAGGYSQRTPTSCCLGKISTSIPKGFPVYDLLDLKLALYSLFPSRMKSGIFLCSSDTIEIFDCGNDINWWIKEDFVAFSHPSTVSVGEQHGVYVLDRSSSKDGILYQALCVLQKPSIEKMKKYNAIHTENNRDRVYTDSLYYFNFNVAKKLMAIWRSELKNEHEETAFYCEIDCYGDFMMPLGKQASISNEFNDNDERTKILKKIFENLRTCQLEVIVLENSTFNHTGTNEEYLDICCNQQAQLFLELDLTKQIGLKLYDNIETQKNINFWQISSITNKISTKTQHPLNIHGCVFHSIIHEKSHTHPRSIIEYCLINIPIIIQINSILSNINIDGTCIPTINRIELPSGLIMQTISVCDNVHNNSQLSYVTFAFEYDASMKKIYNDINEMKYFDKPLSLIANKLNCKIDDLFNKNEKSKSLWNIKLFSLGQTPT
ncbi:unnamed protein product, partial [Didymodactylos carnosus]